MCLLFPHSTPNFHLMFPVCIYEQNTTEDCFWNMNQNFIFLFCPARKEELVGNWTIARLQSWSMPHYLWIGESDHIPLPHLIIQIGITFINLLWNNFYTNDFLYELADLANHYELASLFSLNLTIISFLPCLVRLPF